MKPSISVAWVRKVWKRTTSVMAQPAAVSTARTFSKACVVWATTSPDPATSPARLVPTCPATTTISPAGTVIPCEYMPRTGPSSLEVIALGAMVALLGEPDVLEVDGLAVDPAGGRGQPAGELARLDHRLHQALNVLLVILGGQPVAVARVPLRLADDAPVGRHAHLPEAADGPVKGPVRQGQLEVDAVLPDDLVPAGHPALAVGDVVVAKALVEGDEGGLLAGDDALAVQLGYGIRRLLEQVVVRLLGLLEAALEPQGVEVGRVGRDFRAEEVEGDGAVEIQIALDGGQIDPAVLAQIVRLVLAHELAGALDDAHDARLAHEHVVRLLGQHEAARARQGVEAALGQAGQLVLPVPIGEEAEHEEGQPVRGLLVEGAEDARLVGVSRAPLEQGLGLLAPLAAEMGVEEIDHGPEVPALLDVDLEDVAQVVERGAGAAEMPLLLDGRRLRVALGDDEAAEGAAILARHLLPGGLALVIAEVDLPTRLRLGQEDAPAVLGHPDIVELRPALGVHAHGRAEVGLLGLEAERSHVLPPLEELRLPVLEGPLEPPVLVQADVVGDKRRIVNAGHQTLLRSNSLRWPVP